MKLLVAIDASESSERLLDYVALHWLPRDPTLALVLYHARGAATQSDDGDPLRYARADAIVLGARDRAASRPLGAVATRVLAESLMPVLVVP